MNFLIPQVLAFSLGMPEILLILAALLLLFGAKKLPELAKGMGSSVKEFKKAMKEEDSQEPPAEKASLRNGSPKSAKDN